MLAVTVEGCNGVYTFTAPAGADGIGIYLFSRFVCGSGSDFCKYYINDFQNVTEGHDGDTGT